MEGHSAATISSLLKLPITLRTVFQRKALGCKRGWYPLDSHPEMRQAIIFEPKVTFNPLCKQRILFHNELRIFLSPKTFRQRYVFPSRLDKENWVPASSHPLAVEKVIERLVHVCCDRSNSLFWCLTDHVLLRRYEKCFGMIRLSFTTSIQKYVSANFELIAQMSLFSMKYGIRDGREGGMKTCIFSQI